eukprot:TRINITY_DN8132_c0_g1_i1.p1 TRINITY_DN8132_c0_g1~~TRINITY_DN8132_c0_g1_i1.p1  ORF type:complete len:197 (+),score=36.99 TRINITY_DN8132_c0_g1_i1:122-712(+)
MGCCSSADEGRGINGEGNPLLRDHYPADKVPVVRPFGSQSISKSRLRESPHTAVSSPRLADKVLRRAHVGVSLNSASSLTPYTPTFHPPTPSKIQSRRKLYERIAQDMQTKMVDLESFLDEDVDLGAQSDYYLDVLDDRTLINSAAADRLLGRISLPASTSGLDRQEPLVSNFQLVISGLNSMKVVPRGDLVVDIG